MKKLLLGCLTLLLSIGILVGLLFYLLISLISGSNGNATNPDPGLWTGNGNPAVVAAARSMTPYLYNCPPDNYDQCWSSGFPQAAINYWAHECPGCLAASNGDLQCVMLVVAAYGLAGQDLPYVGNAIDFWGLYMPGNLTPELRRQWIEIPAGSGQPLPGDMMVLSSPYFGGVGHIVVLLSTQADAQGNGSATFAEANGPGAVVTMPMSHGIVETWANYTTLGYIRHIIPVSMPVGMPNSPYVQLAWNDAKDIGIRPDYFVKQINQESAFNPKALSPAGAIGIAQFMPTTAASLGIDPHDPVASLQAAAHLMASGLQMYGGDYQKALAAYNAGSATVNASISTYGAQWLAHMPAETQRYIQAILS